MLIQKQENELDGWRLEEGKPVDPTLNESLKTLNLMLDAVFFTGLNCDETHGTVTNFSVS